MKGDKLAVSIDEVHGAHETCFRFPLAVLGRPENLDDLSIAEEKSCIPLPEAEVDLELVMTETLVFGKDNDHIFKRQLSLGQPICRRDQRTRPIGEVCPA